MSEETSPLLPSRSAEEGPSYIENGVDNNHEEPEASQLDVVNKSYLTFVIPMSIGIFLAAMDGMIVVSSYAAIGSEFKQLQNTSWLATAYMLTSTSFQPLYGKLSDIFGRKECLLFAYSIFAIGSLGCGLSRNMMEFIASRAFAGIGGAGMASAFLIQVPLAVLSIISVSLALHLPKIDTSDFSAKLKRIDFAGSVVLILTIFSLLFGLNRGGNIAWSDNLTVLSLGGSVVCLVLFGIIETRLASEPFAPKRIIFNQSLIAAYAANFFGLAAGTSTLFHVSLYLQAVLGKSASGAGLWLVVNVVGGMIGSLGGGLAIQATGKFYLLTVASYGAQFLGVGLINIFTRVLVHSTMLLGVGLAVASTGNGSGITTSLVGLIANAGQADQAIATAVSYLFRSLGAVVGISVGSTIVQETLRSYLRRNLSGDNVEKIILRVRESLKYVEQLDPATRTIVRSGYERAVQVTLTFSLAMAACSFLSSVFIKEKALTRR